MKLKFLFLICFSLIACVSHSAYSESEYPETAEERRRKGFGSVLGKNKDGGWTIFGKTLGKSSTKEQNEQKNQATTAATKPQAQKSKASNTTKIANSYLWKAALDSVQSMPILVSDSSGGVLSTDWYEDADFPNERYKFNILIKSGKLSTNSLNVTAFKQKLEDGKWKDIKVSSEVASTMKDKIFSRAKELSARSKR